MASKINLASFTFTELFKDLNHDKIFLFILSYEYALNFNQVLTLYNFSPEIFWSYINILKPILKVGDRKAQMLKKSANNVYYKLLGNRVSLTERENEYVTFLSQYIYDSFSDGDICLHLTQIDKFPVVAKGYFVNSSNCREIRNVTLNSTAELFKYIDCIDSINFEGRELTKVCRLNYLLEKYYPDLTIKELRIKNVKEIIEMLDTSNIEAHFDYLEQLADMREEARSQRIKGSKELSDERRQALEEYKKRFGNGKEEEKIHENA